MEGQTEKILEISEISDEKDTEDSWSGYDGYRIKTTLQDIKILISNGQGCCENWGSAVSEDKLDDYIGANLVDVKIVDTGLNQKMLEAGDCYDGGVIFLNLETNKGTLQFAVYNHHNGYYGHEAKVISNQVSKSSCL